MAVGRGEIRIPGELTVEMGVDIDKPRCHQSACGIDFAPGNARLAAHLHQAGISHRYIARYLGKNSSQ